MQESLRESNPGIDVHEEIYKQWYDFYAPQENEFRAFFTDEELKSISDLEVLIVARDWNRVYAEAEKLLSSLVKEC
ncbi:MAG: hypothetical protein N4A71_25905 [Carboxylicivirga sp.]|nr:hypothetical protein [Carboxylicivirga sp.]